MLENMYSTKMSTSKRLLQMRFEKIRSDSGRLCRLAAVGALAVIIAFIFYSAIVMAALNVTAENTVKVYYNGIEQNLKNAPFISNSELYLPLREIMNICGVSNESISYDDGNIKISFDSARVPVLAEINIDQSGICFDKDSEYEIMAVDGMRTTTHPALLVNGTAYAPLGMIIRIKNYYIAEDFDDRVYLELLEGLEVRRYTADGMYDAVIETFEPYKADRFNPKAWYNTDERVVIGTASEFDNMKPEYTQVNGYYFPTDAKKRILIDDDGRVLAVIPYENFRHERVDPAPLGVAEWRIAYDYIKNDSKMKRGGLDLFLNESVKTPNGEERNYAMLYCFVDFRYLVQ